MASQFRRLVSSCFLGVLVSPSIFLGPASAVADNGGFLSRPVNDTGIDWGWNGLVLTDFVTCAGYAISAQDCAHGRDATHDDGSDGHSGFSFTKLDQNGNALSAAAEEWACVRDEVSGLTWEVKTDDGGLRDPGNTFSWYDPNLTSNGGFSGYTDRGNCAVGSCDTYSYAQTVNSVSTPLCGNRDWRVPTRHELRSIVNYRGIRPTIDTDYFPFQVSGSFWTSHPHVVVDGNAWLIDFRSGFDDDRLKSSAYHVRLVRGPQ